MKGKLFIAALALLAVAACNKPEKNGPTPKDLNGDQYMAVNLKMSGNPATKAWDADEFEDATSAEIAVGAAQFLFFNGENQCADIFKVDALTWGDPDHGDSDQKKADAIIVLENPTAIPTSIVAVLNTEVDLSAAKLSDLTSLTDFAALEGKFVMSNSVYVENGEVIIGTPVTADNIGATTQEALNAPVEIHVERVLAKVELNVPETVPQETPVDSEGETIAVTIDGFWLDNTNPNANLVKDLSADALDGDWWTDVPNFRSYWAASADPGNAGLGRGAFEDASMEAKYVNENTPAAADVKTDADDKENHVATQICFAAHIGDGNTDYVKYLSTYYTIDNWKQYIANTLGKYYFYIAPVDGVSDGSLTKLTVNDLVFSDPATGANVDNPDWKEGDTESYGHRPKIEAWEAVYTVSLRDLVGDEVLTLADKTPTTFAEKKFKVQLFKGGATYFYAPIRHNDTLVKTTGEGDTAVTTPQDGYYGIVRNHLYKVNATKIVGLGTPVPDPEQIIIPQKPVETESYIAAEIDVLKYKVVENDYVLE